MGRMDMGNRPNIERLTEIATKAVMDTLFLVTIKDRVQQAIALLNMDGLPAKLELASLMSQMRGFREALLLTDQKEKVEQLDYLWEIVETHPLAVFRYGRGGMGL